MSKCPFCKRETKSDYIGPLSQILSFSCDICGKYTITEFAHDELIENSLYKDAGSKISAYLKQREINGMPRITIFLDKEKAEDKTLVMSVDEIINNFPKSISERIDRTLINLSKISGFSGNEILIKETDYPIFFTDSSNLKALYFMLKTLYNLDYLEPHHSSQRETPQVPTNITLTAKGLDRVIELEGSKNYLSKQAFVAMWFDLGEQYEKAIKKAIQECGYDPMILKDKEHNEKICDHIIAEIKRSKFIVCDFTGERGNVYFEAGFARGLGRDVIWLCREDEIKENKLQFDTRQFNHIIWKDEEDLYLQLLKRIQATIV